MFKRLLCAVVVCAMSVSIAPAQTIRFDTNVGTFDMELNPTGNANLQGHVDNMLAYVNAGRYDQTVINRAVDGNNDDPSDDFIIQLGGFLTSSLELPSNFSDFVAVNAFAPVIVDANNDGAVDFDVSDLLNVRRTVSLALSNSANTGTSSFFVNLGTNTSLDAANLRFVPFAEIIDMTTIDLILGLEQANLSDGGLGGDDVPLIGNNLLVIVERAFVLDQSAIAAAAAVSASTAAAAAAQSSSTVPEPSSLVLAAGALALLITKRGKIA